MEVEEGDQNTETRVWLTDDEVEQITEMYPAGRERWIALQLLGRGGFKIEEVLRIKRKHVILEGDQPCIQISGAGFHRNLRQCPIPVSLAYAIKGNESGRLVTVSTRTVRRWVKRAGSKLADQTGKENWELVTPLDLRRSWADILLTDGIPAPVVMQWGGWSGFEAFQATYMSRHRISSSLEMASQSNLFS